MNNEDNPKALPGPGAEERERRPKEERRSGGTGIVLFFTLLIALAGAGGSLYNYYSTTQREMGQAVSLDQQVSEAAARYESEITRLEQTLEDLPGLDARIAELDEGLERLSARVGELGSGGGEVDALAGQVREIGSGLENLSAGVEEIRARLSRLAGNQEQISGRMQGLAESRDENRGALILAEAEHLLVIASQELNLQRDAVTATAALQAADELLAGLGEPGLYDTRRRLAADMNTLRAVEQPDITGISLSLADMAARAGELPLQNSPLEQAADNMGGGQPPADTPAWRRLVYDVWGEVKDLFVITRTGADGEATMLPNERYFIYLNLRLQLEAARLSVLRRDTGNLRESMRLVHDWLNEYFDTTDNAVAGMIRAAERLAGVELAPRLPDIAASLTSLREYMRGRGAGPQPGAASP